jgi:hypothetical protein
MPRVEIDYSNTIIYKISCKDTSITDIYVGHTTNFIQRKHTHKQACNNIKSPYYNLKLYKTIREHGNWSNWDMSIVNFYNCKNHLEARHKEQEHFLELNATLNSVEPLPNPKLNPKQVKNCPIILEKNNKIEENNEDILKTNKANSAPQQSATRFKCIHCDYSTSRKNDYSRHILTPKHHKANEMLISTNDAAKNTYQFKCSYCDKTYNHKSSLCKHVKMCLNKPQQQVQIQEPHPQIDTTFVIELLKQNQELQKSLIELSKEKTVTNNSITNSNNKTFNIQVYLNEDCKDALNISEFVSSIQLQLHDLEETGRLGYVDGVSQIITTKLNDLDATKRPIQCSDVKRETLYIKDENKWIKEDDKKEKIKTAIKQITRKNIQQIPVWVKANPGCLDPDSKNNDTYLQIVSNAMSGSTTEEQSSNLNKIVTKISKESIINK